MCIKVMQSRSTFYHAHLSEFYLLCQESKRKANQCRFKKAINQQNSPRTDNDSKRKIIHWSVVFP